MKRILMGFMLMPFMALATTLNDGLVAWYKFDGNLKDASGHDYWAESEQPVSYTENHHGIENAAIVLKDNAVFSGNKDSSTGYSKNWVTLSNHWSVAIWFKTDQDTLLNDESTSGIYGAYGNIKYLYHCCLAVGNNGINCYEHDDFWMPATLRYDADFGNRWHHLVLIADGADKGFSLFVDGQFVKNGLSSGREKLLPIVGFYDSNRKRYSGLGETSYGSNYDGALDDFRIYNRALSVDEVKVLYMQYMQTLYVDGTTGSDENPGTSPTAAKKTIQAAIDASVDGDTILVAPGTYAPIVSHAKKISIVGCGNVSDVVIDGGGASVCAILCDVNEVNTNTLLRGFTLRNGYSYDDYGAAGVTYPGAATYRGKVENCIIMKCTGPTIVVGSAAYNCLICSNKVTSTGVLMHNAAYNCTVVDNDSAYATWDNGLYNVLCWNSGDWHTSYGEPENHYNSYKLNESPKFVDAANGDYRLAAGSPCIDAGKNDYVVGDKDLEGCGRIVNGTVDIGCYEFEPDGGPYKETVGDIEWTYTIKGGRASVGDGTVAAAENLTGAVSVPTWLRQRPVNAIDDNAFVDCDAMTSVTIPAGIKTMGDSVFEGCSGLKDLYIESDTLSSVGADVFKWCHWDLIVHVPATWQGRGRTLGGYTVWKAGSSDEDKSVSVTVTNVVVQYVLNSVKSEIAVPVCGETGFVTVITEITSSGAVSIPVEWKDNYPLFEAKFGTDFANALRTKSGKKDCANNDLLVWQDFVAGTDPTDKEDVFTASVTMVGGKPVISYTPELSAEETAKRVYTTYGKKSLTDGSDWEVVEAGNEADYNFFKVSVRMK